MAAMEQQKQEIGEIRSLVMNLGQYVNRLTTRPEQRATPPTTPPVPEGIKCLIATTERYGGEPEECEGFVVQFGLFFGYQPQLPDHAKVSFVITRLTGKARTWGVALVTNASQLLDDYAGFIQELKAVFYHTRQGRLCRQFLLRLRQGFRSAADYAMEFWTLAVGTCWNEPALVDAFIHGLRADLQAELMCKPEVCSVNEVVPLAITYDRLLQERHRQGCHSGRKYP
ncbi:hypothetical protein P4O66_002815 [Electrophorus voltai]|uniref:DUF4939 domain-containing protein n=1 Tax=Electrophorus voltai TaxID=2609070 RepID=A0AAD8YWH6_9TELE|nr:hypothetical protein P4O66_002815 [Electrophorus voltai]